MPLDSLQKYGFESLEELNAFRYTDFSYRTFIEAARKEKYFNNTIFVFIGDHGIPGNAGNMFPAGLDGTTAYFHACSFADVQSCADRTTPFQYDLLTGGCITNHRRAFKYPVYKYHTG